MKSLLIITIIVVITVLELSAAEKTVLHIKAVHSSITTVKDGNRSTVKSIQPLILTRDSELWEYRLVLSFANSKISFTKSETTKIVAALAKYQEWRKKIKTDTNDIYKVITDVPFINAKPSFAANFIGAKPSDLSALLASIILPL